MRDSENFRHKQLFPGYRPSGSKQDFSMLTKLLMDRSRANCQNPEWEAEQMVAL